MPRWFRTLPLLAAAFALARSAAAQQPAPIRADEVRRDLFRIADDSMGGRDTGSRGNVMAADYVASVFRAAGLEPAGEAGSYFQTLPFVRFAPDTTRPLIAGGRALVAGRDFVPVVALATWPADGRQAVFAGSTIDTASWPASIPAGRLVVFTAPSGWTLRAAFASLGGARGNPRFAQASAFALVALESTPPEVLDELMQGRLTTDTAGGAVNLQRPVILLVSRAAAGTLVGGDLASARAGQIGPVLSGAVAFRTEPLRWPARNVIGVLRGSDAALGHTYVSVSAHNDHVGFMSVAVDHDSTRAFNRVVRPMGADSRPREPTAEEAARIRTLLDSLRHVHGTVRRDSIFNGADDDGSGTVALLAIARSLGSGPRPRRSILLVSHAAEERGLLGSAWFTDHPTLPRDSIVAEIDLDMIGRGDADDLPKGGSAYLEVVGAKRLSTEFGTLLEAVNARQAAPFAFNYEYDAPGHPLQYYCRADHYSYARYGIPSVSWSRGEHLDYHQITDEPQYIDYEALARVATLARDAAAAVADLDHRPAVDGARTDPHAPCRQ